MQKGTDSHGAMQLYPQGHQDVFTVTDKNAGLYKLQLGANRLYITREAGCVIAAANVTLPSKSETQGVYTMEALADAPAATNFVDAETGATLFTLAPGGYRAIMSTGMRWLTVTTAAL